MCDGGGAAFAWAFQDCCVGLPSPSSPTFCLGQDHPFGLLNPAFLGSDRIIRPSLRSVSHSCFLPLWHLWAVHMLHRCGRDWYFPIYSANAKFSCYLLQVKLV